MILIKQSRSQGEKKIAVYLVHHELLVVLLHCSVVTSAYCWLVIHKAMKHAFETREDYLSASCHLHGHVDAVLSSH